MASGGFPGGGGGIGGGGGSDFFSSSSRSIMNPNNNSQPQNNPYRTQLSQIFLDSSSQIAHQQQRFHHSPASSYIGKRSLSEYQASHFQQQQHSQSALNPALNAFLARSVKPRMYQNQNPTTTSPISTLSPIEFSANNFSSPELPAVSQRYGFPLLQQLRPQPINLANNNPQVQALQGVPFANSLQSTQPSQMSQSNNNRGIVSSAAAAAAPPQESEKKMMNRLQELEKQLLDDDDDDNEDEEGCGGGDAVSVITNTNSEWSETIQNLISPSSSSSPNNNNNNPISPSSSSSTTSSTTTSAATPAICTRPVLMEAAAAIYEGKSDSAAEILSRVGSSGGKGGNSEQRLMDFLFSALKSRVNPAENPPPVAELYGKEHVASTHLLFERSPCFKLGFMAANLAILESTLEAEEEEEKQGKKKSNGFHVVDFDIGQGGQYVNLLYALADRLNGSTAAVVVKITAVPDGSGGEEERQRLNSVGDELRQLAERLGLTLRFSVAASCKQLADLSRESLGCEAEEPLAVNFAFKLYRMADESVSTENPRDELLRRVRAMEPRVVTVVEQEMNGNTAPFLARVNEACGYYGALLESIEATVPSEAERGRVEEGVGRKLANAVACEGRDRVERCEVFGKWRARFGMAGFKPKPLSQTVTESMRARLKSANWANPGFTVKEDNGGACFGWMGKSLTVASAWR